MGHVADTPEERFAVLVEEFRGYPGVTLPMEGPEAKQAFGTSALRLRNKIVAMLARERLVVKLPAARVDALVASGDGTHFDAGKGRPMKQWLSLEPASNVEWLPLVREAMAYAAAQS